MLLNCNNRRHLFRIAVGTTVLALLLLAGAGAATNISACGNITTAGEYVLNTNLNSANISTNQCINITVSNVTFDGAGYTIDGASAGHDGVYVYNSSITLTNVTVKNLTVINSSNGIHYQNVENGNITNNNASSNNYGIYLYSSSNSTLTNNTASSNKYGIYLISSSNNNLTNNTANSNVGGTYSSGIRISTSAGNLVQNNVLDSNNYGVLVDSDSGPVYENTVRKNNITNSIQAGVYLFEDDWGIIYNITVAENIITGGDNANGIHLESYYSGIYNNTIRDNTIQNAGTGIYLEGEYVFDNDIMNNTANSNSQYGIRLDSSSNSNTIYNNYFNNTDNAYDDGSNTWNTTKTLGTNIVNGPYLGGNFLADPDGTGFSQTCTDADGDGICDSTYYVPGGEISSNTDNLPLALAPSIIITITSPANNSVNDTGYVNVTVTLNKQGTARLNWQGVNESMLPAGTGTSFYNNKTELLSGNYSFKVYANDSGVSNVSETRIVTVNRAITVNISANINATTGYVNATLDIPTNNTNITVTIPNNTKATLSDGITAISNITTDSVASVNSTLETSASNSSLKFLGKNLTLKPEGAKFDPYILVRFNYSDADVPTGVSTIKAYWYNSSTSSWEDLVTNSAGTNPDGSKYIEVRVPHFSTFALMGAATTTTTTTGGSSGSGYYSVTPTPVSTSTIRPTPTETLIQPTEQHLQPTVTVTAVTASTKTTQNEHITGILAAILGFALPKGEGIVSIAPIIALLIIVVALRLILRRKK